MVLSAKRIDPEPGAGTEIMRKTAGGTMGYDFEILRFIEISHSREYCGDFDKSEEIKPENIIRVVD